jgi:hypothetical protein
VPIKVKACLSEEGKRLLSVGIDAGVETKVEGPHPMVYSTGADNCHTKLDRPQLVDVVTESLVVH